MALTYKKEIGTAYFFRRKSDQRVAGSPLAQATHGKVLNFTMSYHSPNVRRDEGGQLPAPNIQQCAVFGAAAEIVDKILPFDKKADGNYMTVLLHFEGYTRVRKNAQTGHPENTFVMTSWDFAESKYTTTARHENQMDTDRPAASQSQPAQRVANGSLVQSSFDDDIAF